MDLFGVNGDDSDDLEPLSPPNKRCARELFTATGRSAHVAAAEQQQHAGFLDFEAFDLNSQAQTWPRVTDMLQSSPIPNYLEAEVGRDLCSKSVSHLGMPSSHPGVAQPSSSWGVNVATNAAKSCRTPRTAGASTRAARGSRRSATTHKRTARSSGASRGNRNGATATRIHNMPSFSGAPPQQQYENDDLEDGLSQINFRGRACRQPPNSSAVSARQPPMPAGASGGCGTPHNGDGVGWSDSIHMFSEEDGGHNMDDEGFFDDSSNGGQYDKANWSSKNTTIFCDLCVEEMRAGNHNNGFLTSRAYKNIADHYYLCTGLRHSRQQLKNRWQQLKRLYSFWLSVNKKTGNGSIFYDDEYWESHTKGNTETQNLRFGPPEWLDQFEIMYEHIAVDGSTSCIPGEDTIDEDEEDNDDNSRRKGGNTTISCATSPRKKSKMPMPKIMKGIWDTMQDHNNIVRGVGHGEVLAETIKKAMKLVVECGARAGTPEHFMACQLFEKPVQREIFFTLETKEERLNWLKMWCQKKNNY